MHELLTKGQDPQAGGTDWTLIGSACDSFSDSPFANGAVNMNGANHIVSYVARAGLGSGSPGVVVCYNHGSVLQDQGRNLDATVIFCDTQNVALRSCTNEDNRQLLRDAAPHSLQAISQVITNQGYSPVVDRPDRPTCTTGANKRCT